MPPKQKGQNIQGRDKIFRNAVEHVHIGVGHHILGNLSLQLAAGPPPRSALLETKAALEPSSTTEAAQALLQDRPAFYVELNAQLLSHSSKDFKSFRWEVLELCETKPLFQLNHKQIAQKLLLRLMDRSGGTYGHKSQSTAAVVHGENDRGTTSEAFEGFVRLTIAFARDMQDKFLPYYEVFQQAVQAGLYDKHGQLLADVDRLQLVYAVQAMWCREMAWLWTKPEHLKLVRRIIRVYVKQMHDTKEYIRRLAAEWLAFLCRQCRELLALVVEESCSDVLSSFEKSMMMTTKADEEAANNSDAAQMGSDEEEDENATAAAGNEDGDDENEPLVDDDALAKMWASSTSAFIKDELPNHPVTDSLGFFCAEMVRGMRGAVNSSFEFYYFSLLESFLLMDAAGKARLAKSDAQFYACLDDGLSHRAESGDAKQAAYRSDRWSGVFSATPVDGVVMITTDAESDEGKTCRTVESVENARQIVREMGSMALGTALAAVLRETRKHAAPSGSAAAAATSSDDEEDNEEAFRHIEADTNEDAAFRPSHRLLRAVVACLQPARHQHVRILSTLMTASHYLLWQDTRELELLKVASTKLREPLKDTRVFGKTSGALDFAGAVLHMLYPICVAPYTAAASSNWLMHLQKVFLPLGRSAVNAVIDMGDAEAQVLLFAFSQDVLQKHFAFCLAEERRLGEEVLDEESLSSEEDEIETEFVEEFDDDALGSLTRGARKKTAAKKKAAAQQQHSVASQLTPLALTLLHSICAASWSDANKLFTAMLSGKKHNIAVGASASSMERALLLARMMNDRTRHLQSSPLQQLLRLKAAKAAEGEKSPASAGAELLKSLEMLVLSVAQLCDLSKCSSDAERRQRMAWLSVALPLIHVLASCGSTSLASVNKALTVVLSSIGDDSDSLARDDASGTLTASYALYAQVSALLVHMTTNLISQKRRAARLEEKKKGKHAAGASNASKSIPEELLSLQTESRQHLCHTITILANGFRQSMSDGTSAAAMESLDESTLYQAPSNVHADADQQRLLYGTEQLLDSLLNSIGMQTTVDENASLESSVRVTAYLRTLALLRKELPDTVQREFVEVILLEALACSVQPLRVLSLRLLQLLCHPSVNSKDRFLGAASIEAKFFDALIGAETFNPLSQTGNLDGIRQSLTPVMFAVESGAAMHSLERVILARAMTGLLFVKFAEAWPIATKILTGLVRQERTLMIADDASAAHDAGDELNAAPKKRTLDPIVWNSVIARYSRLLLFGDVINRSTAEEIIENNNDYNSELLPESDSVVAATAVRCCYPLSFTDQQRHEKGELVSKTFSSSQYMATGVTLVNLAQDEQELITWVAHSAALTSPSAALAQRVSTDRATIAKVFLGMLEDMMRSSSPLDRKVRLVENIALELVAIQRNEHPSGLLQVKRLDERVVVAMNACSVAPSPVLSGHERKRVPAEIQALLEKRVALLSQVYMSYVSDANGRLQRAAIDNLKRLKVEPFFTHHSQLTPYCDTMKACFTFLASFHVETDIAAKDRADYIASALTIALPKLIGQAAKDKRKDQAVLRRRMMGFVSHLSDHQESAVVEVMDSVVQRLVFSRIVKSDGEEKKRMQPEDFNFPSMWRSWVAQGKHSHCTRRLEQLLKQLLNAINLLDALLHAVGRRFIDYVPSCLHLVLQSYLVSCKSVLREPLDELVLAAGSDEAARDAASRFSDSVQRSLGQRTIASLMAQVRRGAISTVALLFEQFPEEVMGTIEVDKQKKKKDDALFGQYMRALYANAKGATHDGGSTAGNKSAVKSYVTPVLRLITAWSHAPELLPLFSDFSTEVVGTFAEVFAVNTSPSTAAGGKQQQKQRQAVHKASPQAIYEALSCLTSILSQSEEQVRAPNKKSSTTLGDAFIRPCILPIFTSLYQLIVRGAGDAEEAELGENNASSNKKAKQNSGNASGKKRGTSVVMSFRVTMWKEIIQTISLMSAFINSEKEKKLSLGGQEGDEGSVAVMMAKLIEVALKVVTHPLCVADGSMAILATSVVDKLVRDIPTELDEQRHVRPLMHLMNIVTHPQARLSLCGTVKYALSSKVAICDPANRYGVQDAPATQAAFRQQLAAVGRAIHCLNSFEDGNESLDRYDYELRSHAYNSLIHFFANDGNYGALSATQKRKKLDNDPSAAVRHERDYSGDLDVHIPLDKVHAPVLCVEGFYGLAANVIFFLRDPESTIRAMSMRLLQAMMRYATSEHQRSTASDYAALILIEVVRREIISSLRRGIVAKDVAIRMDHMASFSALARHYPEAFPSFARLHSPNSEQNFFVNVGNVQPKSRLHALMILRREAPHMHVRDLLRVFIPFLMSAVKDFAQGKRSLQNMSEGRARGYCDAVLLTIATIAEKLPWEAYYRVLSLFLSNANASAALRAPMLRGVVQVLNYFHFLDEDAKEEEEAEDMNSSSDADGSDVDDEDDEVAQEVAAKRRLYRNAKIMHVLEQDIIPQLFGYLGDGKQGKKALGMGDVKGSNAHSVSSIRKEQEKEDKASTKNAILQLPVAVAITKIVKRFPEDRFNVYVDHLLNELILKLRTKNDKHRESARRILGAMLQETGPTKLRTIVTKLKDNLIHGYQLHVLGYTIVTLLYQLYEPHSAMLKENQRRHQTKDHFDTHRAHGEDPVQEALHGAQRRRLEETAADSKEDDNKVTSAQLEEDEAVELAEEDLLEQLMPYRPAFDYQLGVDCITAIMDDLLLIFLDDYLGEVGMQKTQVELMSKMVEMKRNRSLQGFSFIAKHCEAKKVMEVFLHRITWVLTPPSDTSVDPSELHGSARARAMLVNELRSKYTTVNKTASADLIFVNKVRLLAVRVARSLMTNPTMEVAGAFEHVRVLLDKHSTVREEKIRSFEAKDGTRRIRGNAHLVIHKAERHTLKDQRDKNYLVAPVPERVDVDFSSHTILATQQKQKLRVYKGRYGKELKEAAKDFYREDPSTAVVLDTVDEFLLKFLLSVLKRVLGIGKERKYSSAAMKLDLIRRKKKRELVEGGAEQDAEAEAVEDDEGNVFDDEEQQEDPIQEGEEAEEDEENATEDEEDEDEESALEPQELSDDEGDDLDAFAAEQEAADDERKAASKPRKQSASVAKMQLSSNFTREYHVLLESLLPSVLTTLQGEGSDPVVATALDCLLALVSLRPPLKSADSLHANLFDTVTGYFGRGGPIKQRAMRVCAAVISQQPFKLSDDQAAQLIHLIRAEIMDRSEFLPMSLTLFYAVLSKHSHIAEIYDLIDIITELMVHLSSKRMVRSRCILILVRFLTEFRLTKEKFRSHIDLLCKNLDFPDLSGRLALLEALDTLVGRLPAVVVREEAPVLLVPLAATLSSCEWRDCRQRAGRVLQNLAKNAGIDVLVPLLSSWMGSHQPRPTRAMAVQTWATIIPALSSLLKLDTDADLIYEEDAAAFSASCHWSVSYVLEGCLFDQMAAAGYTNKTLSDLSAKARERVELKGWSYIFFSLRCAEAMCTALPYEYYPRLGETLLPVLMERLVMHTHPWVQAASMRLLRHFCYKHVEERCAYLTQNFHDESFDEIYERAHSEKEKMLPLIYCRCSHCRERSTWLPRAQTVFSDLMSLLKRLLTIVGLSDVSNEKYTAHQAMNDPARTECLKLMVYVSKAIMCVAQDMLSHSTKQTQHFLRPSFMQLHRHMHTIIQPALKQQSVVNYMVRTATMIQFFGGYVSVLPNAADIRGTPSATVAHTRWLAQEGMGVMRLVQDTIVPVICLGLNASPLSQKIAQLSTQSAAVIQQQIEERRCTLKALSEVDQTTGTKRTRSEEDTKSVRPKVEGSAASSKKKKTVDNSAQPTPDEVLFVLATALAKGREARHEQQIVKSTQQVLKRNRHEMLREEASAQKGRPSRNTSQRMGAGKKFGSR